MTDTLKDLEASTVVGRRKLYIPPPLDVRTFLQLNSLYTPEFGGRSFSAIVAILRAPEDGKTTSEVVLFGILVYV